MLRGWKNDRIEAWPWGVVEVPLEAITPVPGYLGYADLNDTTTMNSLESRVLGVGKML